MHPILNDTKWDELRRAMHDLGALRPRWRTKDISGYLAPWDGEWFSHFRLGGYDTIEWAEIETTSRLLDGGSPIEPPLRTELLGSGRTVARSRRRLHGIRHHEASHPRRPGASR